MYGSFYFLFCSKVPQRKTNGRLCKICGNSHGKENMRRLCGAYHTCRAARDTDPFQVKGNKQGLTPLHIRKTDVECIRQDIPRMSVTYCFRINIAQAPPQT